MLVGHTGVGKTQLMAQVVASLGLGTTGSRCKVQKITIKAEQCLCIYTLNGDSADFCMCLSG
jgi:hypothetical protein